MRSAARISVWICVAAMVSPASAAGAKKKATRTPSNRTLHLVRGYRPYRDEAGWIHIKGLAKNDTGHSLSYAEVMIRIVDESGAQVGTALANTEGLPAGARWKFDAMANYDGVCSFRLDHITGR